MVVNAPLSQVKSPYISKSSYSTGSGGVFYVRTGRTLGEDMFYEIRQIYMNGTISGGSRKYIEPAYMSGNGQLVLRSTDNTVSAVGIDVYYID